MKRPISEEFDDLCVARAIATVRRKEFEAIINQEGNDEEDRLPEIQINAG